MTELSELRWFSAMAEKIIDPALREIAAELMARNPEYLAQVRPDASPYRREASLWIASKDLVRHPLRDGRLVVTAGSPGKMSATRFFHWINSGKASPEPLELSDAPDQDIGRLARAYAEEFFRLVEQTP